MLGLSLLCDIDGRAVGGGVDDIIVHKVFRRGGESLEGLVGLLGYHYALGVGLCGVTVGVFLVEGVVEFKAVGGLVRAGFLGLLGTGFDDETRVLFGEYWLVRRLLLLPHN